MRTPRRAACAVTCMAVAAGCTLVGGHPSSSAVPPRAPVDAPSVGLGQRVHPPSTRHLRPRPTPAGAQVSLGDLQVPPGHGAVVYLTFDDGPSPFTGQVLAALAGVHAQAVFCLIGDSAVRRRADVHAEVAAGDLLCDHSRDHRRLVASTNPAWVAAEVNDGLREIESVDRGAAVRFYRQPFGLWTRLVVHSMYKAGLDPLRWTDDPRDWSRPGTVAIVQRVLRRLRPGAVVLMHDGGGDRRETVAALRWLLPRLQAAGWRFGLPTPRRLPLTVAATPE